MFKIGNSKELPPIPDHLSVDGKDFIGKCLQRDPSKRPTASELLQHPFVNSAALIEKSIFSSQPVQQLIGVSSGACIKVLTYRLSYCLLCLLVLAMHINCNFWEIANFVSCVMEIY